MFMWTLQQRMWLPMCYSTSLALLGLSSRENFSHLIKKIKKSKSFTLSARLLTLLSICLNFEIPNTVRSHELFLVQQEGHVCFKHRGVRGLPYSIAPPQLGFCRIIICRGLGISCLETGLEDKLLDLLLLINTDTGDFSCSRFPGHLFLFL